MLSVGLNSPPLDGKVTLSSRTVRHEIKFVVTPNGRDTEIDCLIRNFESRLAQAHSQHQMAQEELQRNLKQQREEKDILLQLVESVPHLAQNYHARLPRPSSHTDSLCKSCKSQLHDMESKAKNDSFLPKNSQTFIPKSPQRKENKKPYGSNRSTTDLSIQQDQGPELEFTAQKLFVDNKTKDLTDSVKTYKQRIDSYIKENIRLKEENSILQQQLHYLKQSQTKYQLIVRNYQKMQEREHCFKEKIRTLEGKVELEIKKKQINELLLNQLNEEQIKADCFRLNAKYKLKHY